VPDTAFVKFLVSKGATNRERRMAFTPRVGELNWFVEYVVSHHHRKRIFMCKSLPSMSSVGRALANWCNKVRWKEHFAMSEDEANRWWYLQSKLALTPQSPGSVSPDVEMMLSEVSAAVFERCRVARDRFHGEGHLLSNINPVAREGFKVLKKAHKPAGQVVLRPIHSTSRSPFEPLGKRLAKMIKPKLAASPFLVKDTDQLLERPAGDFIPSTAILAKCDIKDFFTSGLRNQLLLSQLMGRTRSAWRWR
jgi:hypothetical protein